MWKNARELNVGKCRINATKFKKKKVPKGIENSSIAEDAYEAVLHRDIVQEGTLGVGDEGVRDPEQRHQASVQTDTLVPWEHQPGITPALAEEDSGCVILKKGCEPSFIYPVYHFSVTN